MSQHASRTDEPRRRHKRFRPPKAQVTCIPRGFWNSVVRRSNVALQLKDVSLGGAQLILKRALKPGVKTDVILDFPGFLRPVAVEADVRWCLRDTLSLAPRWNAGLTFKRMAPEHEAQLVEVDRTYLG